LVGKRTYSINAIIVLQLVLLMICATAAAEQLSADAAVERTSVFVGEPFIFQIQVSGSDSPEQPDLSQIEGFSVTYQGGSQNNSTSVTIINGKMTQDVRRGYVFSYQLVPQQTGTFTIPSITVRAEGKTIQTRPVTINVQKPAETDNFKLRLSLSKDHCYVGEPVTLTITWYISQDVRSFSFNLPLLEQTDAFSFIDPEVDTTTGAQFYRIPLGGGEVIGKQGHGTLDGTDFTTITFSKVLIPKTSGVIKIEPATVACEALAGYQGTQRGSPFDNDPFSQFFNDDFFNMGRQGRYQKIVVPSNALELQVKDVPEQGRPDNFAGHIGEYTIKAKATPTEVKVGDPITLTLTLSGPEYLDYVTLPPLSNQPKLAQDFKIPQERAVGEIQGKTKIFTQTIRALRPDIREIPSIELPYFNTKTGKYDIARTAPIPIIVNATNVVTALDAEGREIPVPTRSDVETWTQGIAYNYEDLSVLTNQRTGLMDWLKSPVWLGIVVVPPGVYLMLLFSVITVRKRNVDPLAMRAKKAYRTLLADLKTAGHKASGQETTDIILNALRNYLGDKLRMPPGALLFNDVRDLLAEKGVTKDALENLKNIFEQCEASRYAGTSHNSDIASLSEQVLNITKQLEKILK
jgi:hypothetical protein